MNKVLIVEANLQPDVFELLSSSARTVLEQNGIDYERIRVSGIFEIPAAVSIAIDAFDYDGIIVLGNIIGEENLSNKTLFKECARGINDLVIHFSIPIGYGVYIASNNEEATELALAVGKQAATTCIELIKIRNLYQTFNIDASSGYKN